MRFTMFNRNSAGPDMAKINARADAQRISESPKFPSSETSGVMHMDLAGRFENERARLGKEFTEADRQWRIKWIQDQNLRHGEPYTVPGYERANINFFRRIYRFPLDKFEDFLATKMERPYAELARKFVGRAAIGYGIALIIWYRLNYSIATWEVSKGWRIHHTKTAVYPGDVNYPMPSQRTESWQHYDRKFHDRKVLLDP